MYLGDYQENSSVNFKFTTRDFNGIPTALTSGVVNVYKGSNTTGTTSGVTLTTNFASISGLNHVTIDLSVNSFYSTGTDFQVVLASGTISNTPVSGEVLEMFSIRNRATELTLSNGIESGFNMQQALRLILSAAAAKLTGADSGNSIYIRDINDTKNRIVATVTNSGTRSAVTLDVT